MLSFKHLPMTALALGVVVACAGVSSGATEICFRANATVVGPTVTLKDVANVSGSDAETVKRLEQTPLAPAPAAGRSVRLEFEDVRLRIEATGLSMADTSFSGATMVVVSSKHVAAPVVPQPRRKSKINVSDDQVKRAEKIITKSVRQSLRGRGRTAGNVFLDVAVDPNDVPIVLASATEGFEIGTIDANNVNPQNVLIETQDSRGRAVKFHVQCVVSQKPRVPVLNRSVSTGEVIREDDLVWKQVEETEGMLTKMEELVGKEAKKGLHADEPLHADEIHTIPLVRSNDIVTAVWQKGGIRITEQFKAKSDGGKGDVITLVQLTGRDHVLARVTDVHEAEIVSSDAARPANADADSDGDDAAPVRAVAHRTTARKPRRLPPVINAAATSDANPATDGVRTSDAASEGRVRLSSDDGSEPSSR
jgi:flagella basal body P-ring formation protein FlgA